MFEVQWPLVLFSLLAGTGGLTFASAALAGVLGEAGTRTRFIAAVTGLVLLAVGGCFSLLHLTLPQNVMAAVTNIFSFSGISIELVLLGITAIIVLAYAITLKREVSDTARNVLGVIGIIAALLLGFFCGHGYIMVSRPLWVTELLPLSYLGTSLAAGVLVFAFIQAKFGDEADKPARMPLVSLCAAAIAVVTVVLYVVFVAVKGAFAGAALCYGAASIVFALAALALVTYSRKLPAEKQLMPAGAAAVCALLAGVLVRCLMWALSNGFIDLFTIAETTRTFFI